MARLPYKKKRTYRKKKPYRKKKSIGTKSVGLSRATIAITRERETYFLLHDLTGNSTPPFNNIVHTTDGGAVGRINVLLNDLPGYTDFTNMFRQYKITGIKIIFYPAANTTLAGGTRDGGPNSGNGVLVRVMKNQTGVAMQSGNTIAEWSQVMAKRQWILNQRGPSSIYCPVNQLVDVRALSDLSSNEQAIQRPKFLSTNDPAVAHLGLNIRFDSLNGVALSNSEQIWPEFRIVCKYYIKLRGVA